MPGRPVVFCLTPKTILPARYNESLGKDEWDVGLAARDPSRAEHLAFSEMFMEVDKAT